MDSPGKDPLEWVAISYFREVKKKEKQRKETNFESESRWVVSDP